MVSHPISQRALDADLRLSCVAAIHSGVEVSWVNELRLAVAGLESPWEEQNVGTDDRQHRDSTWTLPPSPPPEA